jgi:hypothetical protein
MSTASSGFKIKPPATNSALPQKPNTEKYSTDFMNDLLNPANTSYTVSSQQSLKRNSATSGGFCITKVPATQDSN